MSETESFPAFPSIPRLKRQSTITEKIDGTNGLIFISDEGVIRAGSRNRWITPGDDNYGFARWVDEHKAELANLGPGHHYGEYWGCLSSETSISLADGSTEKIGKIVNARTPADVLSYNFDTQRIEAKKIIGWKKAESTDQWLTVRVKRKWRGGKQIGLHLTPNHVVFRMSQSGLPEEVQAGDLSIGDVLFINAEDPTYLQQQLMLGSLLGDASLSDYSFTCGHSNQEYTNWKLGILKNLVTSTGTVISGHGSTMHRFSTKSMPFLRDTHAELFNDDVGPKTIPVSYVKRLHPCGLAVWYMDDGSIQETPGKGAVCSIYTNGFTKDDVKAVSVYLNDCGYQNYVINNDDRPILKFTPSGTIALHSTICTFVPSMMRYKIISSLRKAPCVWDTDGLLEEETKSLAASRIESITDDYAKGTRSKVRYDIEVEDNHNFFANNLLVHNSGIQRRYGLAEKRFSLFNSGRWAVGGPDHEKLPACCNVVPVLYTGPFSDEAVEQCLAKLKETGSVAAPGFMQPEGIVIFLQASRSLFKVTLDGDGHKGVK